MVTEVLAYRLLLLLSSVGSLVVAARVYRRRSAPASGSIAVLLVAMAEWALAVLLVDLAPDTNTKLLFNAASYLGIAAIPVAWVAVALQYSGFHRQLTPPWLLLLSLVPLLSVVAVATNGTHGLFWSAVEVLEKNGELSLELAIGPWFVVHTLYSYLLLAVGVGLLTRTILGSSAASYKQTTTYLIALTLPWTANILYHLGIGFFPGRDPTPAAFGLTAVLMAVGHARFQLLDVIPVARSAIIEALTDAVIVVDSSQRIAELNPTAGKLLAVEIGDALGQPAARILDEHPILLRQCAERSESQQEVTLITTGGERHFDLRSADLRRHGSMSVARVLVLRDITERKRVDEELRRHRGDLELLIEERTAALRADIARRKLVEKALRESEEKLKEALRIGKMGSWEYDLESREVTWSSQLFELVDRDPSLGPPEAPVDLASYYPKDSKRLVSNALRAIETGETFSMDYYVELPSGRSAYHHTTLRPVRDPSGRVSKVMGTVHDITERKRMEDELVKAQKLESVGVLAGGIAHDFNNILSSIWGNIDLAKMDIEPRDRAFASLDEAVRACHHAADLTARLLTFSKGGTPVKKPASIAKLIRAASDLALSGSNVRCEFDLPDDSLAVEVDEGQINQVFHNLILNAIQAMPEGGAIHVRAEKVLSSPHVESPLKPGEYVTLSIQDHGTGITKEHLHRIFDPYFTTKQTGSGLGLAVVHSIIAKHDGHVRVESELGEGTTFHIDLPACAAGLVETKPLQGDIVTGEGRVLLMDDDEMVISMAGRMLTRLGYHAGFARNGSEAIELYEQARESGAPFDAVILDLTIRGSMGGREVVARLREVDPEVRAIVSSGYSNDPVMADFEAHGFVGVIPKPYEIRSLSEALKTAIAPSR
jgi:PAS domain S-box-containing protein